MLPRFEQFIGKSNTSPKSHRQPFLGTHVEAVLAFLHPPCKGRSVVLMLSCPITFETRTPNQYLG